MLILKGIQDSLAISQMEMVELQTILSHSLSSGERLPSSIIQPVLMEGEYTPWKVSSLLQELGGSSIIGYTGAESGWRESHDLTL